jgi:hypothetical protein
MLKSVKDLLKSKYGLTKPIKYCYGNFDCYDNELTSLKGAPRSVGGNFYCNDNKKQFTEEEVRAVCKVGGKVFV